MRFVFWTAAALCIASTAVADSDDSPNWRPNNAAAISITGPIVLDRKKLYAGRTVLPLRLDSRVAAFKPGQGPFPARIYAVSRMADPMLLNGKTLCGNTPPTWIVVVPQPPAGLELDAFTGVERPASAASPGLCNTFAYTR